MEASSVGLAALAPASGQTGAKAGPSENASFQQLAATYAPASTPDSSTASAPRSGQAQSSGADASSLSLLPPPADVEEPTVWLARAIYSETKLPHEQELVAWVIRNRVETTYRGQSTYRGVVLDPYQFSAFNPGAERRSFHARLGPEAPLPRWREALWVARYVRHAKEVYRPFSVETRHFYSERSMQGPLAPGWADRAGVVAPDGSWYVVDSRRFRFFKQVS